MQASTQIEPGPERTCRLRIAGRLSPLWAGDLATGLAAQRIRIVSGSGRGVGLEWTAAFLLDFSGSATIPESVDYLNLAAAKNSATFANVPSITSYTCARLPDGRLEVWVYGPDQPGLLAGLLGRMASSLLFLSEFEIQTRGSRIEDRFVLVGMGGGSPAPEVQAALEKSLRALCTAVPAPVTRR